ncbi:MAG: pyrroline-5-carboxylate reductase [Agathobacter sp.]|nr:pyrroline-5-carboxylate reductase [Agathobacter sp.]
MKIGFIGCGNMGQAMLAGMIDSGKVKAQDVFVTDKLLATRVNTQKKYGVEIANTNTEVAMLSDIIILAVKPQFYEEVIAEIKGAVWENKILISIAPGKTLQWLGEQVGKPAKIVRAMPNTPALVKEGMMGICANMLVAKDELDYICKLFNSFSKTEIVPEHLMDVVTAVSGSSPAYVFMFIEAMADAAVEGGMPRKQAYTFASQAVLGSAKMVLETGIHPGELKDMVCSPAGTTIQAVRVLEEHGMRAAVMDAMKACIDKSRNM